VLARVSMLQGGMYVFGALIERGYIPVVVSLTKLPIAHNHPSRICGFCGYVYFTSVMFDSSHNYHSPQFVFIFLASFVLSFIFPRLRPSLRASRLSLPCAPSPVSLPHCCLILSLPSFPLISFLGSRTAYTTGPGSDHPSGAFGKHRNSEEGSGELHTVWSHLLPIVLTR